MYKVIIIDDEKAAIETLRRDLEVQADLEIKGTAGNGAKGKKLIMDIHPDLLFLDIELPDIQGIRLLGEIREQVLWDMKVVFYTAGICELIEHGLFRFQNFFQEGLRLIVTVEE